MMSMFRAALVPGALSVLVLAACGGSPSGTGVASAGSPKPTASATASASANRGGEENLVKWMQCMRANGVQVEDPREGGRLSAEGTGVSSRTLQRAQQACRKYVQAAGGDSPQGSDPRTMDKYLKFAKCMRQNGVDLPDPTVDANGDITFGGNVDRTAPRFKAAEKVCEKSLPGGPGAK